MPTGEANAATHTFMYCHGGNGLRQYQLFPRNGQQDRVYRKALKYTKFYSGTLPTLEDLLARGEKVTLLSGQTRSDDPEVEKARYVTAMKDMSCNTKKVYLGDCAAAKLPPPCRLHSTIGLTGMPWQETVVQLVKVGVIPSPWLAADGSVHSRYEGQLYCPKVGSLIGMEVGNDGRRDASARAHRERRRNGSSTSNCAEYHFVRQQRRVEVGMKVLGRPPTRAEVLASPELFEPNAKQPTFADNVICASCLRNVASPACMGLVLYAHNHYSGVGLITDVCRACDTSGRPINDALIQYDVAASDVALVSESVLRLMGRGGGLGELTDEADDVVAEAMEACKGAAWPARDAPPRGRKSRRTASTASDDVLMAMAPLASSSSRSPSPSPPPLPPPSPPPRRRSPRARAPGAADAEFDHYLADVTRLLDKMAGLPSCSRADRARDALEILRS